MMNRLSNRFLSSSVLLAVTALLSQGAIANAQSVANLDQLQRYGQEGKGDRNSVARTVTNVNQLSDVRPTDWYYRALQNLVETYPCIEGFPDGTFRGQRNITRAEFASALNACLSVLDETIKKGGLATGDLATIQRLQEEFAGELATYRGRLDSAEGRIETLEENQFSTTTKLAGEVVFAVTDSFTEDDDSQTVFQNRVRLNFVSSFTGKDQLNTRLDAGNAGVVQDVTPESGLTFNFNSGNTATIGWIGYYFPIGDDVTVYVSPAFPLWQDFAPTISPYLEGFTGANNALSSFAESSPIYKIGLGQAGAGFTYKIGKDVSVSGGYFAGRANDPEVKGGLTNGEFTALGQLAISPGDFSAAITYARGYFNDLGAGGNIFDTGIGTSQANAPFGQVATSTDSVGVALAYEFSKKFAVNAFGVYTKAQAQDQDVVNDGDADIWSWGVGLSFPNLGKKGSLGAILVGAEPWLANLSVDNASEEENSLFEDDMSLHIEALYRYKVNSNLSITPGVIVLPSPNGNDDNDVLVIGTLRTTFTF